MNSLISLVVVDQEPRVDSRLIAEQLGVEHKNTRELIEKYLPDFEEFGVCPFETAKPLQGSLGGRPEKFYLTNEDQSYLLLTYTQNTPQARDLKKRLVRSFGEHRRALSNPHQPSLPPVRQPIRSRNDLSFTQQNSCGHLQNWVVAHDPNTNWHVGVAIGKAYFEEVQELAQHDVEEARLAVQWALVEGAAPNFAPGGWGIECGFAEAIATALFAQPAAPNPRPIRAPVSAVMRQLIDENGVYEQVQAVIAKHRHQGIRESRLHSESWGYRRLDDDARHKLITQMISDGVIVRVEPPPPAIRKAGRPQAPLLVARAYVSGPGRLC